MQVWFVFSGNGSQWSQMGLSLLRSNAIFAAAVEECAKVLEEFNIDLIAEFQNVKGWKTPLLGAVGLLAVQVGLVDVLKVQYGVHVAGMLGHSAGASFNL